MTDIILEKWLDVQIERQKLPIKFLFYTVYIMYRNSDRKYICGAEPNSDRKL